MSFQQRIKKLFPINISFGKKRSYEAAQFHRLLNDWFAVGTSQDAESKMALPALRNRARELARNNDWVRSFLLNLEVNVVGLGIRMQAQVTDSNDEPVQAVNKQIEKEWKRWCRADSCDVTGENSFQDIERLIMRTIGQDGESPLIRLIYERRGRSKVRLSLQILEADRIDDKYSRAEAPGQNAVRMGIEIDTLGKVVGYHILERHPGDTGESVNKTQKRRIRVDAKDIIHFFKHERPEQRRAVTWLASAMVTIRHLKGFIDASVIRKRISAAIAFFIKNEDGEAAPGETQANERVSDVSPGSVHYLNNGEDLVTPQIQNDSANDGSFQASRLQDFAAGTGSSYESISRDFSKTSYSSGRSSLLLERAINKVIQKWFYTKFHQRVFEIWMEHAYLANVFSFPDFYLDEEKYNQPRWMPRGWDWVDPLKDILAAKEALKAGLTTYSDILAERGLDFEETMLQRQKEDKRMKALGIQTDIMLETEVDRLLKAKTISEAVVEND